jgi:hypothetical protein
MIENNYLTNIPKDVSNYGLCKVFAVRREIIHIKHILTEIFVRRTIDIEYYLIQLDMSLFSYIEYITNRIRKIHHFTRKYFNDIDKIIKDDRDKFFPTLNLYKGLNNCIVLDFDDVITKNNFNELYELCCIRSIVHVCSANPTIDISFFNKRGLSIPYQIHSMKGKIKKIKRLLEIQKKYDYVFYVDNEIEYLKFAWIFGIQTYHWNNKEIKYFSLKSR